MNKWNLKLKTTPFTLVLKKMRYWIGQTVYSIILWKNSHELFDQFST